MHARLTFAAGAVVVVAVVGCVAPAVDRGWPEPRPLRPGLPSYRPPAEPAAAHDTAAPWSEPTGRLTLRTALASALMRSPSLESRAWEVRAREAAALQADLPPNPELEVEVEEFNGVGEREGFDTAQTALQLSQVIELGWKRSRRTRLANVETSLAGWDYETKRLDVLTEVAKAYVDVVAAQQRVALARELLTLSEQVLEAVRQRIRSGKASGLAEAKAKVEASASRIAWQQSRHALDAARTRLSATWGNPSPRFDRVAGQLDAVTPVAPAEHLARLVSQNPNVARWAAEQEQRRASVAMEQARAVPDVTVGFGFQYFQESEDWANMMVFSIPLPVFDRNQGAIREARFREAKAAADARAARTEAHAAFVQAYQALAAAYDQATLLRNDALPAARQAFDGAREGYRRGKFGYLDMLDAQRTFFEARSQHIQALADYHKAVADVERLIGQRLAPEPGAVDASQGGTQ